MLHADRGTTRADGRTDMMKIIIDPLNFVNAPKKLDIGKMFMKFQSMHKWSTI